MKKILVPCDFSQPAIDAFRFALSVAKIANAKVYLLHVIEMPFLSDRPYLTEADYEMSYKRPLEQEADKKFMAVIEQYNYDRTKVIPCTRFGMVTRTIVEFAACEKIDLVIMGSHGTSGIRELITGSTVEKVVRLSTSPVLIVKELYLGPVKNIVLPVAMDVEKSERFASLVKELQVIFDARLHLVWINTPGYFTSDRITRKGLMDLKERFKFTNCTIQTFNDFNETDGILQFSRMVKGDLIAMATHGRRGLSHVFHGSIAEDVVRHAPNLIWTYSIGNVATPEVSDLLVEEVKQ